MLSRLHSAGLPRNVACSSLLPSLLPSLPSSLPRDTKETGEISLASGAVRPVPMLRCVVQHVEELLFNLGRYLWVVRLPFLRMRFLMMDPSILHPTFCTQSNECPETHLQQYSLQHLETQPDISATHPHRRSRVLSEAFWSTGRGALNAGFAVLGAKEYGLRKPKRR